MKFIYSLMLFLSFGRITARAAGGATNQPTDSATNLMAEAKPPGAIFTNSTGMQLLKMPGGFWAGKFEVTQKQYQDIIGSNPSEFPGAAQPVEMVSWNEAVEFCSKLTAADLKKKFLPEGFYYTLPTEAEWVSLVGDAALDNAVTSLKGNTRPGPSNVGSTTPNSLGLYDVRGNVMEFCLGDDTKAYRFLKGGSWKDFVDVNLRPEFRWTCKPDERMNTFGIRCLLKAKL